MSDTIRRRQRFFVVENAALNIIRTCGQTAFCLYCTLLRYANQEGVCYPMIRTLADAMGCCDRTVQLAMRSLISSGYVSVEQRTGTSSLYTVLDPSDVDGCNQIHQGGESRFTGVVQPDSPPLTCIEQDPHEQDLSNKTTTPPPTPPGGCGGTASDFDAFWSAYPRHVGKAEALKAWRRLKPDLAVQTTIIDALAWQRKLPDWTKEQGRYVPHPATYLNQRRFEDEPPRGTTMEERIMERAARLKPIFDALNSRRVPIVPMLEAGS